MYNLELMLRFILNNKSIETNASKGMTLLDFIRYEKKLRGTKIGCREGDCGACSVLIGDWKDGKMNYKSGTSCVTPLGNVEGRHVVSIEGLNIDDLTPVQKAMVEESGTQCGFCTVGFVVSFSALCFSDKPITYEDVISGIDGNICRCTGYKSIERAAERIHNNLKEKDLKNPVEWLVDNNYIPSYFNEIPKRLTGLKSSFEIGENAQKIIVSGGTDLYVQKHDEMEDAEICFVTNSDELKGISVDGDLCKIGGAVTATELMESEELKNAIPNLRKYLKLISSTQIRNIGTVAGNFVNASPIGDLTAFFIALNSSILLKGGDGKERKLLLKYFYRGYKDLDKSPGEYIVGVEFEMKERLFNFEKVSKRTYLDIATVNTAISIQVDENVISEIHASAGGVGPTPKYLEKTCEFLRGKSISMETVKEATEVIQSEVSPISDARGTEDYKRLLLSNLFFAHFVELFPQKFKEEVLV